MNQIKRAIAGYAVCLSMLSACGGDSPELLRGVFLDSPVQGLQFRTESQQGLTDGNGGFGYRAGESVVFSVGGLEFAQVPAQATMTPLEVAGSDDIGAPEVISILRLLQTIDEDKNPDNGIVIRPSVHEKVLAPVFGIGVDSIIGDVMMQAYGEEREIVDAETALDHLITTLSERVSDPQTTSWDVEFLYFVEADQAFDGSYLSIRGSDFELNLNNGSRNGRLSENAGVYELIGDDARQYFTPGVDADGANAGCLANRPTAISECQGDGQLFSVFFSEAEARNYSELQLAANIEGATDSVGQTEPEFEAAQPASETSTDNTNPDLLPPEDRFPACSAALVDEDGDQYGWENEATCYFVTPSPDAEVVVVAPPAEEATVDSTEGSPPATIPEAGPEVVEAQLPVTETAEADPTETTEADVTEAEAAPEVTEVIVEAPLGIEAITDLFFLTGQANAANRDTAVDATLDATDQRVFAYTDTGWQVADLQQVWEPGLPGNFSIQTPERSPYNSIAFQVAKSIAAKSDRVVGLVVLSAPGEGISHWDYNSEFFVEMREKATAALNELPNKNSFDAMFWMQGETDWLLEGTADPGATGFTDTDSDFYRNYYPNKLFQLISNLRSESWLGFDGSFICAETKKADLNAHLLALNSDSDANTGCAEASDLSTRASDPFANHFSAEALRTIGNRIADVYLAQNPESQVANVDSAEGNPSSGLTSDTDAAIETQSPATEPTEEEATDTAVVEVAKPTEEEITETVEVDAPDLTEIEDTETAEVEATEAETAEIGEVVVVEPLSETEVALVAVTNCPTENPAAPATFSVDAIEPAGCSWVPFTEGSAWTWGSNTNYDQTDNTVTDTVGALHQGNFAHSCIDASGEEITVTAYCEVAVDSPPGIEAITDLFFLTGQANAASEETAYDATLDAADRRVFAYTDGGWQVADLRQVWEENRPGNFSIQNPERSPYNSIAFQTAKSIAAKSDRVVGLVVLTAPSEGISHWDFNSDFYNEIREKASAALNSLPNKSSFDAMFWLQGETDWLLEGTADPGATGFTDTDSDFYRNYYPNKLFQLISNLRSESWFGFDSRFICAETKKAELNTHLLALNSDSDANTGCAEASDLNTRTSDPFGNHFSAQALRILGGRIADVYLGTEPQLSSSSF